MNDYYWDNYTEMDQYGYEDFDNQRALLNQVNANEENRLKLHRYKKMVHCPFFGSVDFIYDGPSDVLNVVVPNVQTGFERVYLVKYGDIFRVK